MQFKFFNIYIIITAFNLFNSIFFSQSENDSSSFSPDGPVIIYSDNKILSYSIAPHKREFSAAAKEITKDDILTCYIDDTRESFSFRLKENIQVESSVYPLPEKMLVISDIEGNFNGFSMILKGAGVISDNYNWSFGNGHLVLAGDFFDRGLNVTETLWLIYKLELEAESAGGKVHFIIGNHEMMNLKERFKYVRKKYFVNADSLKLDYKYWYGNHSELGRWLRSKNSVEKIGDFIFVHGGIRKDFPVEYDIEAININMRECIDKVFPEGTMSKDIFIGGSGPLWYRDIVEQKESQEDIENTLKRFGAVKMIAGHTIVDSIKYLYDKKVIAIDLHHEGNTEQGFMNALWFENSEFYVVDNNFNLKKLQ